MVRKVTRWIYRLFRKGINRLWEPLLTGVVFAVIASLLTTGILSRSETRSQFKKQLDNISNIYIGCNKSWADQSFGNPQFSAQEGDYLLCAYVSDYYVLQFAFDSGGSAQAYLITALKESRRFRLTIDDKTLYHNKPLVLGNVSYYDFPGSPLAITGFVSNGSARALYAESYYFAGGGGYYDYHIASLDFGIGIEKAQFAMSPEDAVIDDEVSADLNRGAQIITNRSECCPNSYGVSASGFDMDETLFSYHWFNSQQLRNQYLKS